MTGGDPMCRADLLEMVRHATGRGLRVSLSPSATPRLVRTDFGELRDAGVRAISLSLDGATEETHDAFRGIKGPWEWTMQALRQAREAELPVQINTTITRHNLKDFGKFAALMDEIRPVMWSLFQLIPTGRAAAKDLPTARQVEGLFERLYEHARSAPYAVKTTEGHHYRRVILQSGGGIDDVSGRRAPLGINDGKGFVFVSHLGEICPSGFLPVAAGNVRCDDLLDVYRHRPLFRKLRDPKLLKGKCGLCEYRRICGGSRARAYALTGDYLAAEPLCSYIPKGGAASLSA
jgi:radical SAM protein with 4Fe4S-binding SPASM domain